MIKLFLSPLPTAALEKLIEAGNYVLEGKHGSYYIDWCDVDEDSNDFGSVVLTCEYGDLLVVKPENISYSGSWIQIIGNDGYKYQFTLERRQTIFIEDIAAELN